MTVWKPLPQSLKCGVRLISRFAVRISAFPRSHHERSPVDSESWNVDWKSAQMSNMTSSVRPTWIRVHDDTVEMQPNTDVSDGSHSYILIRSTDPKCTLSTLTPSGKSASAALPAKPPSYRGASIVSWTSFKWLIRELND